MAIKVRLKETESLIKQIKNLDKALMGVADLTEQHLKFNWLRGRGGDGTSLQRPSITPKYRRRKIKRGRVGRIDMFLNGDLIKGFIKKRISAFAVSLRFTQNQRGKAKGNIARRPQIMKLSRKFKKAMTLKVLKFLQRR